MSMKDLVDREAFSCHLLEDRSSVRLRLINSFLLKEKIRYVLQHLTFQGPMIKQERQTDGTITAM